MPFNPNVPLWGVILIATGYALATKDPALLSTVLKTLLTLAT